MFKMAEHTDVVSPLTDIVLVYGTESFQMGFGFITVALPQVRSPCTCIAQQNSIHLDQTDRMRDADCSVICGTFDNTSGNEVWYFPQNTQARVGRVWCRPIFGNAQSLLNAIIEPKINHNDHRPFGR